MVLTDTRLSDMACLSAFAAWLASSGLSSLIIRGKNKRERNTQPNALALDAFKKVSGGAFASWESAELAKEEGRTRDRTGITGIRIRCANHYTIQPIVEANSDILIYILPAAPKSTSS